MSSVQVQEFLKEFDRQLSHYFQQICTAVVCSLLCPTIIDISKKSQSVKNRVIQMFQREKVLGIRICTSSKNKLIFLKEYSNKVFSTL